MPVKIKKVNGYRVSTPSGVKSKGTTKKKAERQANLLRAVEHSDWRPTGQPAKSGNALRDAVMGSSKGVLRMAKARMKKRRRKKRRRNNEPS